MGNPRKNKDKDKAKDNEPASKTRDTQGTEEGATARTDEADEPSTSQRVDAPVEMSRISHSQTNRMSRSQPSMAETQCFTTCPILTIRTRSLEIS